MNALMQLDGMAWWHVAGWTMLHYLWMGALVGVAALVSRMVLRRASANVRYAAALVCLTTIAVLPVLTAAWLVADQHVAMRVWQVANTSTESVQTHQRVVDMPTSSAPDSAPGIPTTMTNPRQGRGLTGVPALLAAYLPWVWIFGAPLTLLLLTTGVVGAERLRRQSRILFDGPVAEAEARIAESLKIGRRVTIAVCERIAAPVLVGIVRPMILLPPAALTGWSPDEIEMVLLHELAHVRRWDNLVNLLQRLAEAVLFFQPAVWLVSNWVRREREACCDAVVVSRMQRPHAYAELLVALASQLPRSVLFHPAASSAMAAGPLRGRVRRILGLEDDPMLISGKSLGVVLGGLLFAATLMVLNLPQRTTAEEPATANDGKIETEAVRQELTRQAEVMNQLKNLALALHNYHDAKGTFPANASYDTFDRPLLSWRVHILPYLEDDDGVALYKEFRLDEPWDSKHNRKLIPRMPAVFKNPNKPGTGITSYLAAVGEDCVFDGTAQGISFARIPDGTANTIMLVEADDSMEWTRPSDLEFDRAAPKIGLGGKRPNGWLAAYADGSVHLIDKKETLRNIRDRFTRGEQTAARERAATQFAPPASLQSKASFPTLEETKLADDWPAGVVFASPKVGEIAKRAWAELGLKLVPPSNEDFARADQHFRRGLKLVNYNRIPRLDTYIVTSIRTETLTFEIGNYLELEQALDALAKLPPDELVIVAGFADDGVDFEFPFRRPQHSTEKSARLSRFPSLEDQKLVDVPFVEGASRFVDGDKITVLDIQGTAETFEPGNVYRITGTYTLGSHDGAQLSAYVTAKDAANGTGPSWKIQTTVVNRGSGTFEIFLPMFYRGWPHVSFYPTYGGGEGFGGVYFGTGNSVLKKWWDSNESIEATAAVDDATTDHTRFPSLEEQKLADLIWKRMNGLELEPLDDESLKKVRALGYDGGLRNTNAVSPALQGGDILVGLHVWPTTRLQDVANVIDRDDLGELNPLKYYTVRISEQYVGGATVVTGRISVSLPQSRPQQTTATDSNPLQPQLAFASPRANADEIAALKQHVEILERQFKKVDEQYRGGAKYVGPMRDMTAYELALSQGQLFLADGSRDAALDRFKEASKQAEAALESFTKEYEANRVTQDVLLEAARNLTGIKRLILQLEQAPAAGLSPATPPLIDDLEPLPKLAHQPTLAPQPGPTPEAGVAPKTGPVLGPVPETFPAILPVPTISNAEAPQAAVVPQPSLEPAPAAAPPAASAVTLPEAAPAATTVPEPGKVASGDLQAEPRNEEGALKFPKIPADVRTRLRERGPLRVQFYYVDASESCKRTRTMLQQFERVNLNLPVSIQAKNAEVERGLATEYDIERVPALLFLGSNNRVLKKNFGDVTPAQFAELLVLAANLLPEKEPPLPELRYDGKKFDTWWKQWWDNDDGSQERLDSLTAFGAFAKAGYGDDATSMILLASFADYEVAAKMARGYLRDLSPEARATVVPKLVQELLSDLSLKRRLAAMRALAAIGPPAEPALSVLKKSLTAKDRNEQLVAATAIKMIVGKDQYQKPLADLLGEELGIEAVQTDSGAWGVVPRQDSKPDDDRFNKFNDAVIEIQDDLFLSNGELNAGGGGGGGGGVF